MTVIDRSDNEVECQAAYNAISLFADDVIEVTEPRELAQVLNEQLRVVWCILNRDTRLAMITQIFADHDLVIHLR